VVVAATVFPMKKRAHRNLIGTVTAADWTPAPTPYDRVIIHYKYSDTIAWFFAH